MAFELSTEKIKDVVIRRLLAADLKAKEAFPSILKQKSFHWLIFDDDKYFGLIFIDDKEFERVGDFKKKNLHPFPGLITTDLAVPAAFRIEKSKNGLFQGCAVKNTTSFSIGSDSTFIILDHTQILTGLKVGDITYQIPLAYIVSFGLEISVLNAYEHLEDLVAYSIKVWRRSNG